MYAAYLKEREDIETVTSEHGFATFNVMEDGSFYIVDIYVKPEQRRSGAATELEAQIIAKAKKAGAKRVVGSVCLSVKDVTRSMQTLLGSGYRFTTADYTREMLYFEKEI